MEKKEIDIIGEQYFRHATLSVKAIEDENNKVEVAFSSEEPYQRSFGNEVLSHKEGDYDFSFVDGGSAPLLLQHDHDSQIGVIERARVDPDNIARAVVRFSKSAKAQEIYQDIKDGIRSNVSVGYSINKYEVAEDSDIVRVGWTPFEISIVSVPADTTVGVGRSENIFNQRKDIIEEINMTEKTQENAEQVKAIEVAALQIDQQKQVAEALDAQRKEIAEITKLGQKHGQDELAQKAIADSKTLTEFKDELLDAVETKEAPVNTKISSFAITTEASKNPTFSLTKALNENRSGGISGYEKEMQQELGRSKSGTQGGVLVPANVFARAAHTTTTDAVLYPDERNDSLIEILRNETLVGQLGVTTMSGLTNPVPFPKQTGSVTAGMVGETGVQAESSVTTANAFTLSPNTGSAKASFSRRLLSSNAFAADQIVANDIRAVLAALVDSQAIFGDGTGNNLLGVLNVTGVNAFDTGVDGKSLLWGDYITMKQTIKKPQGATPAKWAINTTHEGYTEQTVRVASTDSLFIKDIAADTLAGRSYVVSDNLPDDQTKGTGTPASTIFYGHWDQVIFGEFGAVELLEDPYTGADTQTTIVRAFYDFDIGVRHPEAIIYADGVL